MVHNEREWVGYTYLWNDEQTDAALLDAAVTKDYRIKTPQGKITQSWYYPSRADCMNCHTPAAGFVLGPNTRQMNREHDFGKAKDNQIRTLDHIGVFDEPLAALADKMEAYPDWNEAIRSRKTAQTQHQNSPLPLKEGPGVRAFNNTATFTRAYLDVNCTMCHMPGGTSDDGLNMHSTRRLPKPNSSAPLRPKANTAPQARRLSSPKIPTVPSS